MTLNERDDMKQEVKDRLEELQELADAFDLVIEFNTLCKDRQFRTLEVRDRTSQ